MSQKNKPLAFTIYDSSRDQQKISRTGSITPSYSKRLSKRTSSQSLDINFEKYDHWAKIQQPLFKCQENSDKNICHRFLESVTPKNGKVRSTKELPFVLKALMNKPKSIEQPPKKKTLVSCVKEIKKIVIEFQQIIACFTEQIKQILSQNIFSIENKTQDMNKIMGRLMQQLEMSSESLQLEEQNQKLKSLCFEKKQNSYSSHKQIQSPSNQNRSMEVNSTYFSRLAQKLPQTGRKSLKTEKLHYSFGQKTSESQRANFNAFNTALLKMKRISFQGAIVKG